MSYEKFSADNTAMLLIDHQVGTMSWAKSLPFDELKRNALMLAKTAKILGIPTVLTSSMEAYAQGPLLAELETILPKEFAGRIQRLGIVNAMDDENFAAAVKATGRKKLIIAGVTNDVCTVYPALSLVRDGFEVQVVADAGASPTRLADDIALRRMEHNGVTLTSTNQLIAELAGSWATPEGGQLVQVLMEALQPE
ncbi:isochorismatase family protein [Rhizobium rhizogenes]|uniref:Isochorismatase hydrolase n=1 Tax=Rhizobium rhizogenes (strain K84 / ATCC BAA-868) TaxID=311403 RepID=B9JML2_RHIR8|nr:MULTISPECIES: isochorismatase family protein [Rhizobium]ACM28793.1 Isochorismatase hydrolase [Rhizobium rhizogenes K84]OCJ18945.1 isochorismatase [Agrobacterium sp. B131/95]EJK88090.1 nicotinamidase-like amidase [Rhizobium sp. AP16]NTI24465.1 isochorismatase family protein [Rhizobium rhizogenes]NTI43785.1 isochorismatase family protein [Rhizobium rhizogenes]